jgi:hypothetical protein
MKLASFYATVDGKASCEYNVFLRSGDNGSMSLFGVEGLGAKGDDETALYLGPASYVAHLQYGRRENFWSRSVHRSYIMDRESQYS